MTNSSDKFISDVLTAAPKGEFYLYTNMEEALSGLCGADSGILAVSGAAGVDDGGAVDAEQRDAACKAMVEMTQTPQGANLYLDLLANVSSPTSTQVLLSGGRADIAVSSSECRDKLSVVRLALTAAAGSSSDVVLRLHSANFLLVQLKVNIEEGASANIVVMQTGGGCRKIFTRSTVDLSAGTHCAMTFVNFSPQLARNEIRIGLQAAGAQLSLDGLYTVGKECSVDNETLVEHISGHCSSNQLFKGIASDGGVMSFGGLIQVKPDAQKTEAVQTNRHLLATVDARAYAKPQLEIYADDVRCGHGATTGQLDASQLFYMRQRGIDEESARRLLAAAFIGEVADRIAIADIREEVKQLMLDVKL